MHQETADKLCMRQGNLAFRLSGLFAPGGEGNRILRKGKDPAVGNGDFVGIPPEVLNRVAKAVKGFLNVGAPVFFVEAVFPLFKVIRITQFFTGRRKGKGTVFVKSGKVCHIFSFEFIPQDLYGNEKLCGGFTDFPGFCQPAAGNNAVHMHMVIQFLVPGVEHLDNAGRCPEPLLVSG